MDPTTPSSSGPSPYRLTLGKPVSLRSGPTRGLHLNVAASPQPKPSPPSANQPHLTPNPTQSIPPSPEIPESSFASPLPPLDQLQLLDIDEQLRLLALKEMTMVAIKDNISRLQGELRRNDRELHKLREVIQRLLYKELNASSAVAALVSTEPRDEAIARTLRASVSRRASTTTSTSSSSASSYPSASVSALSPSALEKKSVWSNLSKPLSLIHQFDAMLQHELEKTLDRPDDAPKSPRKRLSEDSMSSTGSASPLKPKSDARTKPRVDLNQYFSEPSDDMLQSVSSSIWSFVNDVKSNVLSSLGEEEDRPKMMYNLETGSAISLDNQDEEKEADKTLVQEKELDEVTERSTPPSTQIPKNGITLNLNPKSLAQNPKTKTPKSHAQKSTSQHLKSQNQKID